MLKIWSITLSILILCQSTSIHVGDIVQLDELMEHSQFHKQQYGDSFFEFLSKHYGKKKADHSKNHQEEKKDHEQLPFQNQLLMCSAPIFVLRPQPFQIDTSLIEFKSEKDDNFYYQMPFSSLFGSGIFQPPRQA